MERAEAEAIYDQGREAVVADLKRRIRKLRRELKPILTRHAGKAARYRYSRRFARNILKIWPALSLGSQSERGDPAPLLARPPTD